MIDREVAGDKRAFFVVIKILRIGRNFDAPVKEVRALFEIVLGNIRGQLAGDADIADLNGEPMEQEAAAVEV